MPTILEIAGWRLFFYSNESHEPMHVHARKADMECKFWISPKTFDITEAYSYGLKVKDVREIRKIVFEHFDYIINKWNELQGGR
ncbi:MAG: DUF4160 domain-containing protein [Candidatus Omnitrophica bacterium]|nr:DUF4160 domain-containing protein [Candidatus Omnitrophota bacterium]